MSVVLFASMGVGTFVWQTLCVAADCRKMARCRVPARKSTVERRRRMRNCSFSGFTTSWKKNKLRSAGFQLWASRKVTKCQSRELHKQSTSLSLIGSYSPVGLSVFFCVFSLGLYFVYSFVFLWFVCVSPSFYVSLDSWVISLTVFGASVTNLNEPPRALATSTIIWVRS